MNKLFCIVSLVLFAGFGAVCSTQAADGAPHDESAPVRADGAVDNAEHIGSRVANGPVLSDGQDITPIIFVLWFLGFAIFVGNVFVAVRGKRFRKALTFFCISFIPLALGMLQTVAVLNGVFGYLATCPQGSGSDFALGLWFSMRSLLWGLIIWIVNASFSCILMLVKKWDVETPADVDGLDDAE